MQGRRGEGGEGARLIYGGDCDFSMKYKMDSWKEISGAHFLFVLSADILSLYDIAGGRCEGEFRLRFRDAI